MTGILGVVLALALLLYLGATGNQRLTHRESNRDIFEVAVLEPLFSLAGLIFPGTFFGAF
jgi:hypothetical protein